LPKANLNAYKAFCKIVPKIADLKYSSSEDKIIKLENEMARHSIISRKNWILDKLKAFSKNKT